eukprot:3999010-Prymnesium_polylepis.1
MQPIGEGDALPFRARIRRFGARGAHTPPHPRRGYARTARRDATRATAHAPRNTARRGDSAASTASALRHLDGRGLRPLG